MPTVSSHTSPLIQSSDPGNLLDGVQPLLLGGLLGFKLGLLLRIGFGRDLRVKLGELRVELLLEGGLAGVGFRIGLLPRGILDSLDLLVDGVETTLDAAYFVARHIADLIPLLLDGGESLTSLLGAFLILDGNSASALTSRASFLTRFSFSEELI